MQPPSSTSNSEFDFERVVPALPWRGLALSVLAAAALATFAWELTARGLGYGPTLNDTSDLWADRRKAVQPDSLVIVGDSRAWFDLDLDVMQASLGQRPIQLALPGSCGYPVLAELADDPKFHGRVVASFVPGMWLAPGGPLLENSNKALKRYRDWNLAQRAGHQLGMLLEERLAFLKEEDLALGKLLDHLPIPDRAGFRAPPLLPPYFQTVDRERRARMVPACAQPGPLNDRVKNGWLPLFTPPPPPPNVPPEQFMKGMLAAIDKRYKDTAAAVAKIRARGGEVVFVRFPMTGPLKEHEDRQTPRERTWNRLLQETKTAGVHFEDHPELASFDCPEYSHLSAPDSVEFTKRLMPHLQAALKAAPR
ncbi:MAG: hypothetical protein JSR82_17485 [Verrucomicrobia bacterium]|nr:hypothetical protein [Verrucomicrobiota bacterium]